MDLSSFGFADKILYILVVLVFKKISCFKTRNFLTFMLVLWHYPRTRYPAPFEVQLVASKAILSMRNALILSK